MDGTYGMHGAMKNAYNIFVGMPEWTWSGFNCLKIGTTDRQLLEEY
jgi:hypothetical protein